MGLQEAVGALISVCAELSPAWRAGHGTTTLNLRMRGAVSRTAAPQEGAGP